jgi:hypothetical protein
LLNGKVNPEDMPRKVRNKGRSVAKELASRPTPSSMVEIIPIGTTASEGFISFIAKNDLETAHLRSFDPRS